MDSNRLYQRLTEELRGLGGDNSQEALYLKRYIKELTDKIQSQALIKLEFINDDFVKAVLEQEFEERKMEYLFFSALSPSSEGILFLNNLKLSFLEKVLYTEEEVQ